MDRNARGMGASFIAALALGCGGGGGAQRYPDATIFVDAKPGDVAMVETRTPLPDAGDEGAGSADGPTEATDGVSELAPCSYGGDVPIYCNGNVVYEPSPVDPCIGGGHIYGMCPNGCARETIQGPVADPVTLLCSPGPPAVDGAVDGSDADDAGTDMAVDGSPA